MQHFVFNKYSCLIDESNDTIIDFNSPYKLFGMVRGKNDQTINYVEDSNVMDSELDDETPVSSGNNSRLATPERKDLKRTDENSREDKIDFDETDSNPNYDTPNYDNNTPIDFDEDKTPSASPPNQNGGTRIKYYIDYT